MTFSFTWSPLWNVANPLYRLPDAEHELNTRTIATAEVHTFKSSLENCAILPENGFFTEKIQILTSFCLLFQHFSSYFYALLPYLLTHCIKIKKQKLVTMLCQLCLTTLIRSFDETEIVYEARKIGKLVVAHTFV